MVLTGRVPFTIARVAEMLREDEDRLQEISIEMAPEDGVIHVYEIDEDGIAAFTDFGAGNLREHLQIHNENAPQVHAAPATRPTERP